MLQIIIEIWRTARLAYLLIIVNAILLQKLSVIDMENLKTVS